MSIPRQSSLVLPAKTIDTSSTSPLMSPHTFFFLQFTFWPVDFPHIMDVADYTLIV